VLVSLLVCLIPTTIGGLLSAIGIAGMDRLVQHNVLAMSGRAVEAAGDVNTLLLDKTGTITLGNRQAAEFIPAPGHQRRRNGRCRAAFVAGRRNARRPLDRRAGEREVRSARPRTGVARMVFVPFTAQTRMSGVNLDGREIRKGAVDAITKYLHQFGTSLPREFRPASNRLRAPEELPLVVAENQRALGVIYLKDIVKGRDARALQSAARHGDQDGDDHRRQSADRGGHRARGGCRRFSGGSDSEDKMDLIAASRATANSSP
jgi:K+-transporting ATPase ATPase B chain